MAENNATTALTIINDALATVEITPAVIESSKFEESYSLMMLYLDKLTELKKAVDAKIKDVIADDYFLTGNQTVKNGSYMYTYKAGTTRESLDTAKIKADHPEIYREYIKISEVSPSITIKKIAPKEGK